MKELSMEQKAKRYDEALDYAHYLINERCKEGTNTSFHRADLDKMFPELKESEDERIRKELLEHCINRRDGKQVCVDASDYRRWADWLFRQGVENITNVKSDKEISNEIIKFLELPHPQFVGKRHQEKWIAWLERQGEYKTIDEIAKEVCKDKASAVAFLKSAGIMNEKGELAEQYRQDEQKHADKVEPKFHEGDWVVDSYGLTHQIERAVENVTTHTFGYDIVGGGYFNDDNEGINLWTIQDAKDGDVLATKKGNPFIYEKNRYNNGLAYYYAGLDVNKELTLKSPHNMLGHFGELRSVSPATKEQRDTLMKAMADAGYTFDFENKQLKKIEQKPADNIESSAQNKHWSEEDEKMINDILMGGEHLRYLDTANIAWLKSIKDRVQPQPKQEWSEKDEIALADALWCCKQAASIAKDENDMGNVWYAETWLKSLKDRIQLQPKQEWSEEDKKTLERVIMCIENHSYMNADDIHWLKSLKDRYTWKPSDEQMVTLYKYAEQNTLDGNILTSLYNDLKKIKE